MPKKYLISFIVVLFFASMLYAGGIEVSSQKDGIDVLDDDTGIVTLNLSRLNPPISAEVFKSLQFQEGNLNFLSADERTYYITGGDILIIKLPDEEEFSEFEVNFEGYITLPKMGNFKAEGLTIGELEKSIFFSLPLYLRRQEEVQVQIKEKRKYIQVLGYVGTPGWYLLPENAGIQGAFVAAGGINDGSIWNEISLYRTTYNLKSTEQKLITVDMYTFLKSTDYNVLPQLKSKDIIVVPMTPLMGTVKRSLGAWSPPRKDLKLILKIKSVLQDWSEIQV
jgi:protein involved in polysaccharide export with SLBB domain